MSTSGITTGMSSQFQEVQQEFTQLGQDLQSGNISSAQSDFVTLQSDFQQVSPTSTSTSTSQSSSPIAQAFSQLSQDLQAGNLSAAQKDYATIEQDFKSQASQTHHHHHSGGSQESQSSQASQLFAQLGQALQSGNLTSAQADFSSLQQLMQGNTSTSSGTSTSLGSAASGLSILA